MTRRDAICIALLGGVLAGLLMWLFAAWVGPAGAGAMFGLVAAVAFWPEDDWRGGRR